MNNNFILSNSIQFLDKIDISKLSLVSKDRDIKDAICPEIIVQYIGLESINRWGDQWKKIRMLRLLKEPPVLLPPNLRELYIDCVLLTSRLPKTLEILNIGFGGHIDTVSLDENFNIHTINVHGRLKYLNGVGNIRKINITDTKCIIDSPQDIISHYGIEEIDCQCPFQCPENCTVATTLRKIYVNSVFNNIVGTSISDASIYTMDLIQAYNMHSWAVINMDKIKIDVLVIPSITLLWSKSEGSRQVSYNFDGTISLV